MIMKDKVALVTGAASGIGAAAARIFAREGAAVVLVDRDVARGRVVAESINASGAKATFVEADVTSEPAIIDMVAAAVRTYGGLDAAFNNAGTPGHYSTALTCSHEEWEFVCNLNMRSVWLCMKHEIPQMLQRGGGSIVNMASRAGDSATPHMFGYVATKHAVVGMSRSAALDLASQNIRVNALCPGMTDTPMLAAAIEGSGIGTLESLDAVAKAVIPMQRLARPEEQAEAAVWLCSDRASYITGIALSVDGGMSAAN
ncbi:MAG: glucose 1-dehydrogenase [Steroidobacteraceae bacterium]